MPQSNTGSTTHECHIQCVKNGDQFQLLTPCGCCFDQRGTLTATLPASKETLRFCTTDFQDGNDLYRVEASWSVDDGRLEPWSTPAPGEHWSPPICRDPNLPPAEERTVAVTMVLAVYGPVTGSSPPPYAGEVRPPTTVVIRSRLGGT